MLGRSNGIYKDLLTVDGEPRLVRVLRVGKLAMFYRTNEFQYGVIKQQQGNWTSEKIADTASINQLDTLFDSYNKNIRNGVFTVPNFLPQN